MNAIANTNTNKVSALAGDTSTGGAASHASPVTFTLPTPPSVNQAYKNTKWGRSKTKETKDWHGAAITALRLQNITPIKGRCIMIFGFERKSEYADVTNRIKLAEDAIVDAGIIEDDRFVTASAIAWLPMANGLTHVSILPVQDLALQFHASMNGVTGAWTIAPSNIEDDHNGY